MKVKIYVGEAFDIPEYQTYGAAGMDLCASNEDAIVIHPGDRKLIPTGLRMEIPYGYEGQIRPRSGLVFKHGVTVLNSPGTIDCDYRGTIGVILHNASNERFFVNRGDRIAQIVFNKVERADLMEVMTVEELDYSVRNENGFGSTGIK